MSALAKFILRGHFQATLTVVASMLLSLILPPISIIGAASIGLMTLRNGAMQGFLILLVVSVIFVMVSLVSATATVIIPTFAPLFIIMAVVWMLAIVLRSFRSLSLTILVATIIGFVYIVIFHLYVGDTGNWWQIRLTRLFATALEQFNAEEQQIIYQNITNWAPQFTGVIAATLAFYSVICIFVARWWQAMLYNPSGFQQEFHTLRFNQYIAYVTLVLLAVSFLPFAKIAYIARDSLTTVLFSMYLFQGLSIGHAAVRIKKLNSGWLVGLYIVSLFSYPLVAVMGFIDTWFDFRRRLGNSSQAA